jgi:hypothetical protein
VTVVSAFKITVQVVPLDEEHPDQDENLFAPAVFAAVSVTVVPALYVRLSAVAPLDAPLLSEGLTVMATPFAGLVESTVRTTVAAEGGVELPPPPQALARKQTNKDSHALKAQSPLLLPAHAGICLSS